MGSYACICRLPAHPTAPWLACRHAAREALKATGPRHSARLPPASEQPPRLQPLRPPPRSKAAVAEPAGAVKAPSAAALAARAGGAGCSPAAALAAALLSRAEAGLGKEDAARDAGDWVSPAACQVALCEACGSSCCVVVARHAVNEATWMRAR